MLKKVLPAALALTLCLSLTGCFMLPQEEEVLAPPLIEPEEATYETVQVALGDMQLIEQVTGYFTSTVRERVSFTSAGRLGAVHVHSGQEVAQGDILMELDNEDLQKKIRDQQIVVEKKRLQLAQMEQSDDAAQQTAQLDLQAAKNKLSDLYAQRSQISLTDTGLPVADSQAEAQYNALSNQIRDQELVVARAQIQYDRAVQEQQGGYDRQSLLLDLEAAQNELADLNEALEQTVLRAPISGRISFLGASEIGATVSAYATMAIITDPTQLVLQYSGTKAANFPVNLPVTVRIEKEEYHGYVLNNPETLPRQEDGSKQEYAQFVLEDYDMTQALEGGSGQVTAVLDSRQDVIVLDKSLVTTYLSRKYVHILVDGLKVERDVQIGLESASKVEILEGLEVGEEVIVN